MLIDWKTVKMSNFLELLTHTDQFLLAAPIFHFMETVWMYLMFSQHCVESCKNVHSATEKKGFRDSGRIIPGSALTYHRCVFFLNTFCNTQFSKGQIDVFTIT